MQSENHCDELHNVDRVFVTRGAQVQVALEVPLRRPQVSEPDNHVRFRICTRPSTFTT